MGVEATTYVWQQSKQSGSKLVVMLALADYASNETGECWPGIEALAEKSRMTTRYLRTILNALETAKEIRRIHGAGHQTETGATNRYVLVGFIEWLKQVKAIKQENTGVNNSSGQGVNNRSPLPAQGVNNSVARGEQEFPQGVNNRSPKPSVEPSVEPSIKDTAPKGASKTPSMIFQVQQALVKVFDYNEADMGKSEKSMLFGVAEDLSKRDNPVLPEEVADLFGYVKKVSQSEGWTLTPNSLKTRVAKWRKTQRVTTTGTPPETPSTAPEDNDIYDPAGYPQDIQDAIADMLEKMHRKRTA